MIEVLDPRATKRGGSKLAINVTGGDASNAVGSFQSMVAVSSAVDISLTISSGQVNTGPSLSEPENRKD